MLSREPACGGVRHDSDARADGRRTIDYAVIVIFCRARVVPVFLLAPGQGR
jgi:hypothetical protein